MDFNITSKKNLCFCIAVSLIFTACKPSLDEPKASTGTADFSRFVAVGTDLTAGYTDGALTLEGQVNSFPAILASRFNTVGGGDFIQPYLNVGNGIGFSSQNTLVGQLQLNSIMNCLGEKDLIATYSVPNTNNLQWLGNNIIYNNYGIPGAKSFNLDSQTFGKSAPIGNSYYHRFASDTGAISGLTSTVLGDAFKVNPTFFSLWIGVNDVLFYAQSGGNESDLSINEITPDSVFNTSIDRIVNSLTSNGAKGIILNIPDVENIPFFNTIPYNGLILTKAQADTLNATSPSGVSFHAGANAFVVNFNGTVRQLVEGELVLLSTSLDSLRCNGLGTPVNPLQTRMILDQQEVSNIHASTVSFNAKIRAVALAKNLAFTDANAFFKTLSSGVVFNGVKYSTNYINGGAFALDGIHLNSKGYAFIANECINSINAQFKSTIMVVDVNNYSGIKFP